MTRLSRFLNPLWVAMLGALVGCPPASASEVVGVRQIPAYSQERGIELDVTVWYPARAGGTPVTLGESVFFVGTPSMRDAPVATGEFPLVLLSHGAGLAGNAQALSWIAVPLAKQGFIVAAPTHPGNTGPHKSAMETMKLWLRPADISVTVDAMVKNPLFRKQLIPKKIGLLGLSMGGNTALAIAGARLDPERLMRYCDTDALNHSLCDWVRQSGVDLRTLNMRAAGRDNADQRIRFVMAIDPAPVDVMDSKSFARISIPVELVNLGRPGSISPTTDASGIAQRIPHAAYATIRDASHYSMFAECKPGAAELAESEDIGDPICSDGGNRTRSEIHDQLIQNTGLAFRRALQKMSAQ